nr:uncharacterized protein LOC129453911 [Misgurnus anguillicaudatus]
MDRLFVFCFLLIMDADVTVSVMIGGDVTLPVNAGEIKGNERLQWTFENTNIVTIDLEVPTSQPNYPDKRFTNRLDLDRRTGSLTISNIITGDTGKFQLEIMGISDHAYKTVKTFNVTVTEVESVSVMKGESVYLDTKNKTQSDDVIEWKFKNILIAKLDRRISPNSDPVLEEKLRRRLHVDLFGFLIIRNINTEDSGTYDVHITNGQHIIQKRFSLTVTESTPCWDKAGPVLATLLVITVLGFVIYVVYTTTKARKNEMNGL